MTARAGDAGAVRETGGRRAAADLFAGPGGVRALARALDWGATPLGWPDRWSPALRIAARAMLDAPFPICLWAGPDLALVYNDAYCRVLGAKHPAALGRPGAVVWAELWPGLAPQFAQVRAGGPPVHFEDARFAMARLPGGATEEAFFSYTLSALRDEDGAVAAVLNIAPETTDRVRAQQALALERTRLAALFEQSPSFLAVLRGPDDVFELVNPAYQRIVGLGREVLGRPLFEAIPEVRGQGFDAHMARVRATGEPLVFRDLPVRLERTPGGPLEECYLDITYFPLVEADAEGREVREAVVAHGTDVTEQVLARREIERLLAEARAGRAEAVHARDQAEAASREAEDANQAKSAFLATMSHELRTPLNAIIGYAQLLDLGLAGTLTDQQRGLLDRLTASGQHLLGLVNDVLDISKIDAGEARVARRDAMTGPAVRAALDLVRPQARAKDVRLVDARPDGEGVPYVGDDDRVRQIVLNLLSNAVKFTGPGGTVAVTCGSLADAAAAAAQLQGEGPWAYVEVRDTGVGIPAEQQARVFEPFHQAESGRTRAHGGTGLGLTISRQLARLMGGDLTLESEPGAGARFTLWLPAARREAGAQVETADARAARAERELRALRAPWLAEVGVLLRETIDDVLCAYADRLRADPLLPRAREMRRMQLEDHAVSFLADLSQSLVIVGDAGPEARDLLRDGSAIQRTIAEHHGARRAAQGWDEAALRRDHTVLREEVERALRDRLHAAGADVDEAVRVMLRFVDRAEAISLQAWRRAAAATRTDAARDAQ